MTTKKRSIMTFAFNDQELEIFAIARELLCKVSAQIPGDYLENADRWDNNLCVEEVEIAQHVLEILHNGGVPTNWEMEELSVNGEIEE